MEAMSILGVVDVVLGTRGRPPAVVHVRGRMGGGAFHRQTFQTEPNVECIHLHPPHTSPTHLQCSYTHSSFALMEVVLCMSLKAPTLMGGWKRPTISMESTHSMHSLARGMSHLPLFLCTGWEYDVVCDGDEGTMCSTCAYMHVHVVPYST